MRRLRCLCVVASLAASVLSASPTFASHAELFVTRSPAGAAPAGTVLAVSARIENTSDSEEILDGVFSSILDDPPYLSLLPGSVTTRYEQVHRDAGVIVKGNHSLDRNVEVALDPVPPNWTAIVEFQVLVASRLPPDVDEDFFQSFLDYTDPQVLIPISWNTIVPILAAPNLSLTKNDGAAVFHPGGTVTYGITVSNDGSQDALGVVLTDTVPTGTRYESTNSTPGWTCSGSQCTFEIGSLAAGESHHSLLTLRADSPPVPAGRDVLVNRANVTDDGSQSGGEPRTASAMESTPLLAAPDLALVKNDRGATVHPGELLTYTLTLSNVGDQHATGTRIQETVPFHATFLPGASSPGWTCQPADGSAGATCELLTGQLAVGAEITATFAVRVADSLSASVDELLNVATATDDQTNGPDPAPSNNRATERTPLLAAPDLVLTKDDAGASIAPGETLSYVLEYRNAGDQTATGVRLTETVPTHSRFASDRSTAGWTCQPAAGPASASCYLLVGNLTAGASGTATFAVTLVDELASSVDQLVNLAEVRDDGTNGPDPTPADNRDSEEATPIDAAPDLEILKRSADSSVAPGDTLTYTLEYRNAGNQDATGVQLREIVPEHTRFAAGASTSGWTCQPAAGTAGAACTLSIGELASGASGSASFAVTLDETLPAGVEEIRNTVIIVDDDDNGPDPEPDDDEDDETTPVDAAPELQLSKDDGGTTVAPGQTVIYQLEIRNAGDQDATGVLLRETVPDHTRFTAGSSAPGWTCQPTAGPSGATCTLLVGELVAGTTTTASFAVTLDETVSAELDRIHNTAAVEDDRANGPDPDPGNDTARDETPVDAAPDLALVKDDGGVTARPGELLTYTLTAENRGDRDASGVRLHEELPVHTTFAPAASDSRWTCAAPPQLALADKLKAERIQAKFAPASLCVLSLGPLPSGASESITFTVRVDPSLPVAVEQIVNTATVVDDGEAGDDADPTNNDSTVTTPVLAAPALSLGKDDGGVTAHPGDVVTYTLTFANLGDQEAGGVVIEETVPDSTRFAPSASSSGWTCQPTAGTAGATCTFGLGRLASAETGSATFAVQVDDELPAGLDQLLNHASILDDGTNGPDPDPTDNHATDSTPIAAAADLELHKTDADATATPDETVVYTLTFRNASPHAAHGVTLEETVPDHTLFEPSASTPGWSCAALPATAGTPCILSVGDLAGGASDTATFAVVVDSDLPANVERITNSAVVLSARGLPADPTPINNRATEHTPITSDGNPPGSEPALDLYLADLLAEDRDSSGGLSAGDVLAYSVTVLNDGDAAATELRFHLPVPDHTTLAEGSFRGPDGATARWTSSGLEVDLAELIPADRISFTFDALLDADLPATLTEISAQASISSATLSAHPSDDPDTTVVDDPTLSPLGSGGPGDVVPIPTLSEIGLMLLSLLLAAAATRFLA